MSRNHIFGANNNVSENSNLYNFKELYINQESFVGKFEIKLPINLLVNSFRIRNNIKSINIILSEIHL